MQLQGQRNSDGLSNAYKRTYLSIVSCEPVCSDAIYNMLSTSQNVSIKPWDQSKPILCDKYNFESFRNLQGFRTFHDRWVEEHPNSETKYLIITKDPWKTNKDISSWVNCNQELMKILQSDHYDTMSVRCEDLISDPRDIAFKLISWCPDLYCLDYKQFVNSSLPSDFNIAFKKMCMDDGYERFNEVAKYFNYRTFNEA